MRAPALLPSRTSGCFIRRVITSLILLGTFMRSIVRSGRLKVTRFYFRQSDAAGPFLTVYRLRYHQRTRRRLPITSAERSSPSPTHQIIQQRFPARTRVTAAICNGHTTMSVTPVVPLINKSRTDTCQRTEFRALFTRSRTKAPRRIFTNTRSSTTPAVWARNTGRSR